jgi:hypothetical protein
MPKQRMDFRKRQATLMLSLL